MIVVKLMGGLGNQMFQYAVGRHLADKHNSELKLDLSFFENQPVDSAKHVHRQYDLDIFGLEPNFATADEVYRLSKRVQFTFVDRVLNRLIGTKNTYVREPHFHFSPAILTLPDGVYLEGYWQTEKYFAEIYHLLRSDFEFKEGLGPLASEMLEKINDSNAVCVNVRRGDFVTNSFHGAQNVDYFRNGEDIINSHTSGHSFFVFSDDVEWCEANLKFDAPVTFVSHEYAGRKFQDYLRLMSACRHFIIPNSSFAWWAVWFNRNAEKTVVSPAKWFGDPNWDTKDLAPDSWIRI